MGPSAKGEQRRALIIAAVGLLVVALLILVTRVLGGDDETTAFEPVPTTVPETAPPGRVPTTGDEPTVPIPEVPESFELVDLRNPFTSPVLIRLAQRAFEEEQRRAGAQPGPGAPGDPTQPGEPGAPSPGARPESRVDINLATEENGQAVAELRIDGEVVRVREGQTFGPADEFQVVSIDVARQCAVILFGDESFTVCVDEADIPRK